MNFNAGFLLQILRKGKQLRIKQRKSKFFKLLTKAILNPNKS